MIVKLTLFLAIIVVCSNAQTYVVQSSPAETSMMMIKTFELTTSAATQAQNALKLTVKYTMGADGAYLQSRTRDYHLC